MHFAPWMRRVFTVVLEAKLPFEAVVDGGLDERCVEGNLAQIPLPRTTGIIWLNGDGLHWEDNHVGLCTSVACGPLGLRRIRTVSHDRLDHPGHRIHGRCRVVCRGSATSVAWLGSLNLGRLGRLARLGRLGS
jgi:hypothetical protein